MSSSLFLPISSVSNLIFTIFFILYYIVRVIEIYSILNYFLFCPIARIPPPTLKRFESEYRPKLSTKVGASCSLLCEEKGASGVCDKCKHIKDKFNSLKHSLYDAENKAERISNAVMELMKNKALDKNLDLTELLDAVEFKDNDPDKWHEEFMVDLAVICEATDLFRSKRSNGNNVEKQLSVLKKACVRCLDFHDWNDKGQYPLDLSPKDLLKTNTLFNYFVNILIVILSLLIIITLIKNLL